MPPLANEVSPFDRAMEKQQPPRKENLRMHCTAEHSQRGGTAIDDFACPTPCRIVFGGIRP